MRFTRFLQERLLRRKAPAKAIILGADYAEYALYLQLKQAREYEVLFFIDDNPWNHKTTIDHAEIRYLTELPALCENFGIAAVLYCDKANAENLPLLKCPLIYRESPDSRSG